jgi:hypothetical protein
MQKEQYELELKPIQKEELRLKQLERIKNDFLIE